MQQETGVDVTDEDGVTSFFGIDVNALHFGAAYRPLPKSGKSRKAHPFVATTIGLSVYDAEPAGFGSGTVFSLALSGGWTIPASDHIGFRFTGRAWLVFQDYAFAG